jgi:tetratricopeptide (TPR) repeat protein
LALAFFGAAAGFWAYRYLRPSAVDIDALLLQAEQDFASGRYDRVDFALQRLSRLRPQSSADHMLRARNATARKQPDAALTELARVPDDDRMASQARLMAGQIELRRDRLRLAEEWFRAALKLDPKLIQAHLGLIYIYGMQLRRAELNTEFLALSTLTSLTSDNVFHWCLLRNNSWDPAEAIATLLRFVAADPDDRWSRLALADNYRRMGLFDQAESELAPLDEANDSEANKIRIQIAVDGQQLDRAEELLARARNDDPALARIRGRLALSRRDNQAALHHFRIALAADPDDREAVFGLACALEGSGETKAAEPFRESAGKLERLNTLVHRAASPESRANPTLLRELGSACAALHRDAEARAWYELAIAVDPLDGEAQRALYALRDPNRQSRPTPHSTPLPAVPPRKP